MAATMVKCAKLGEELPALDPDTSEGRQALKMAAMMAARVRRARAAKCL